MAAKEQDLWPERLLFGEGQEIVVRWWSRFAWHSFRSVTCSALQRRGLVEEHLFVAHEAKGIVTAVTFQTLVPALQREFRALVVVKCRRHPSLRGVALCA